MKTLESSLASIITAAVILCGYSPMAGATTTNVTVESYDFIPPDVSIKVNDSVKWVWTGNTHSTTSSDLLWDSGTHSTGFTFTNKFLTAGSFPYFCKVHTFMVGSVTVMGTNQAPIVSITNPVNGTVFSAPATVLLAAMPSDSDGTITNVQFFQGAAVLGNKTASPYSLWASNLAGGNYTFSTVASDNGGLKATNSTSVSVVTPSAILLSNPRRLSATQYGFDFTTDAGLHYVIERSPNLAGFSAVKTNTAAGSSVTFTDSAAGFGAGFYRVGRLPNP